MHGYNIGCSGDKESAQPLLLPGGDDNIPETAAQQEVDHSTGRVAKNTKEQCYDIVMILAYGAAGQSTPFESDQNQASTSSRTGENTTLKVNTTEDRNLLGGESQKSKPDENVKTKPSGKACM